MKRLFASPLKGPGSAVVLGGCVLALLCSLSSAQDAAQSGRVSRADGSGTPSQADLDPARDLSVSFSTKHEGGDDVGHVFGAVANSSRQVYPCARIEFQLLTRYDQRQAGKGSGSLGTLSTEVKNIQPGAKTPFRERLPSPAGVRLESVSLCQATPVEESEPVAGPSILSFEVTPQAIDPGETVSLHWEVQDAQQVLLFDDFGELESRIELPNGQLGWPPSMNGAQKEILSKTTTFTLVAVSKAGRVTKSFTVNVQGKVIN